MASLYPKKVNGKTYWYLREMARVGGKPRMVSERYLGTAADIAAAVQGTGAASSPERTRHLGFGDVAAVWATMARLDVVGIIDEVTGGKGASVINVAFRGSGATFLLGRSVRKSRRG